MKRSIKFCLVLLFLWSGTGTAQALPQSLTMVYSVFVGGAELGNLSTNLERLDDGYQVTSETRAEGMASILLGGVIRESCRFMTDRDQIRPEHYRFVREGRRNLDRSATFDWGKRAIVFSTGEITSMPSGYVIDNCVVPYAFMLGGADIFRGNELHVVGAKRVRRYKNTAVGRERLTTPLGKFDTIRIEQSRTDKPERRLTVWIAVERNNLPVKIVERRKGRTTTMVLRSVEGA